MISDDTAHSDDTVHLRDATDADLDAIWAIERDVYGAESWSREMVRDEITGDHRRYVVIERNTDAGDDAAPGVEASSGSHTILGYAGLLVLGTDGDIQTIAVTPGVRGAGYGRLMMNELLDEAAERGARQVFLDVRADNQVARELYTSLGFQEIGVRPRYYQPDDIDAIVMQLQMGERR